MKTSVVKSWLTEGVLLDTLELVVGDDKCCQSGQVGEDERRQH